MRKNIIGEGQNKTFSQEQEWLNLEEIVNVEVTSENDNYPIESALLADQPSEWRAETPGKQIIRLVFDHPQRLQRISLHFVESHIERTQEYILRWLSEDEKSFQEIVRQQWNFSPDGTNHQREDHQVNLLGVSVLELIIIPDISGGDARASLSQFQLA
jgi:hypothetical protein